MADETVERLQRVIAPATTKRECLMDTLKALVEQMLNPQEVPALDSLEQILYDETTRQWGRALKAVLATAQAVPPDPGWRDIASAPRDARVALALERIASKHPAKPTHVGVGGWASESDGGWGVSVSFDDGTGGVVVQGADKADAARLTALVQLALSPAPPVAESAKGEGTMREGWHPIRDHDGSTDPVLLSYHWHRNTTQLIAKGYWSAGWWDMEGNRFSDQWVFTHFYPLPPAPPLTEDV